MRKNKLILAALSLWIIGMIAAPSAFSRDAVIESRWNTAPLSIDGVNKEWNLEDFQMIESNRIRLGVRNDLENLYILFAFTDPKFVSSIKETGMSVYLNAKGKKNKDDGFLFKTTLITAQYLIGLMGKKGQSLSEEKKREIMSRPQYLQYHVQLIRKKKILELPEGEGDGAPKPVSRNTENTQLPTYELKIPLNWIGRQDKAVVAPGQTIKIGFEWGGMTDERRHALLARRVNRDVEEDTENEKMDSYMKSLDAESMGGEKPSSFWADLKLAVAPAAP